jgi:hypothetical protein
MNMSVLPEISASLAEAVLHSANTTEIARFFHPWETKCAIFPSSFQIHPGGIQGIAARADTSTVIPGKNYKYQLRINPG